MNSARLLKIVFVILLLVTFGELGYYVYYQFSIKRDTHEDTSLATTQINNPTLTVPEENKEDPKICVPVNDSSSFLNTAILEQLKFIPAALTSSNLTNVYQGEIVELNLDGGRLPIDKSKYKNTSKEYIEYQIGLKIKKETENETLDFYWDSDTLTKIKILRKEGKEVKPINFSDLQISDEIEVHETIDLMNKNCIGFQCVQGFDIYKI